VSRAHFRDPSVPKLRPLAREGERGRPWFHSRAGRCSPVDAQNLVAFRSVEEPPGHTRPHLQILELIIAAARKGGDHEWPRQPGARSRAGGADVGNPHAPATVECSGGRRMEKAIGSEVTAARAQAEPARQAYQILHWGFVAAPTIAGLDKFAHLLTNWE